MSTALINNPPGKICLVAPHLMARRGSPGRIRKKKSCAIIAALSANIFELLAKHVVLEKFRNCCGVKKFPG
jgi:hypothetical protein